MSLLSLIKAGLESSLRGILSAFKVLPTRMTPVAMSVARDMLTKKFDDFGLLPRSEQDGFITTVGRSVGAARDIMAGGNGASIPSFPGGPGDSESYQTTYVVRVDIGDGGPPREVTGVLDSRGVPTLQDVRREASDVLAQQRFRDTPGGGNKRSIGAIRNAESIPIIVDVRILTVYRT